MSAIIHLNQWFVLVLCIEISEIGLSTVYH